MSDYAPALLGLMSVRRPGMGFLRGKQASIATFTIATKGVASNTTVTITATANGISKSAKLIVIP